MHTHVKHNSAASMGTIDCRYSIDNVGCAVRISPAIATTDGPMPCTVAAADNLVNLMGLSTKLLRNIITEAQE